jgi:GNAT superfamily N-acetyltransferase
MNTTIAWEHFIAGVTNTPFMRRTIRRLPSEPLAGYRFIRDEYPGSFDEFFAIGQEPEEVVKLLQRADPQPEHYLTVFADRPALPERYTALGYTLSETEPLMLHTLRDLPPLDTSYAVQLAQTPEEGVWLNSNDPAQLNWVIAENLGDPAMFHYYITLDEQPVARGRAIHLGQGSAYVARVYTAEAYRRRGLSRAIMLRLLHDAASNGMRYCLLSASPIGVPLYEALGFTTLGTIFVFEPAGHQ